MLNAEIQKEASDLLGLLNTLESNTPAYRSCRQAMQDILPALKELAAALWPRTAVVTAPVPDKVVFQMEALTLTYRHRTDGIYLEEKVNGSPVEGQKSTRINVADLTPESVQKAVLGRLKAFYSNVVEAATT